MLLYTFVLSPRRDSNRFCNIFNVVLLKLTNRFVSIVIRDFHDEHTISNPMHMMLLTRTQFVYCHLDRMNRSSTHAVYGPTYFDLNGPYRTNYTKFWFRFWFVFIHTDFLILCHICLLVSWLRRFSCKL